MTERGRRDDQGEGSPLPCIMCLEKEVIVW